MSVYFVPNSAYGRCAGKGTFEEGEALSVITHPDTMADKTHVDTHAARRCMASSTRTLPAMRLRHGRDQMGKRARKVFYFFLLSVVSRCCLNTAV